MISLKFNSIALGTILLVAAVSPFAAHAATITVPAGDAVSGATAAGLNGGVYPDGGNQPLTNDANELTNLRAIIASGASATYTATSLDYNGSDTTATNTFLGLDSNGSAASDSAAIETSIFDATGLVAIPVPGTYTFSLNNSDDASYLFIDGQTLAELPGSHGVQAASGTATFSAAGNYPIEVMYVNQEYNGGTGGASFAYSSDFSAVGALHTELMHLVAVPEPTSLALLSFGAIGTFFAIRRRWPRMNLAR